MARSPSGTPPARKATRPGTALTAANLAALGADRLAELLVNIAEQDAPLARALRMALTATHAPEKLGREITRRLRTIQRSHGFLAWDKIRPLAAELDTLRRSILQDMAPVNGALAAATMRILVELAPSVYERSDDGSGYLGDVFRAAAADLGRLWGQVPDHDPAAVVQNLFALLDNDGYGTSERLIAASADALGAEGAALFKATLLTRLQAVPASKNRDDYRADAARMEIQNHLRELADAMGDVDAYIEAVNLGNRPSVYAGEVARRLLDQNRANEALEWLDRASKEASRYPDDSDDLRIEACEALGRRSDAQTLRWHIFAERLSLPHFRAFQRHLSDYDAIDAGEQALDHVRAFPDKARALAAFLEWPSLDEAARLVRLYATALDGRDYGKLRPAAQTLSAAYPDAASLLYRLLIEAVLDKALSRSYPYAAKDLLSCAALAPALETADDMETHDAFVTRLRSSHKRKAGFWALVE